MSISRHHAEWLSLVEVSGPFLSLAVLLDVFPQGLSTVPTEDGKNLRLAYEEWQANRDLRRPDPAIHRAWAKFVLREILSLPNEVLAEGQALPPGLEFFNAQHQVMVRPDLVVLNPEDVDELRKPRLLVQIVPASQDLEKTVSKDRWPVSPATRMMELLRATNVRLGLVTNGEHWMLVHVPIQDTVTYASWHADLWTEEPLTLRAFRDLLGLQRFFGVDDNETIEALFERSRDDQMEITNTLGYQVRRAVEVIVQSVDRIDKDSHGALLRDVHESTLYQAALTVMMRLVFLLCAEERKLLLLGDEGVYDQNYAVSTLRAQLRETADQQGEEILERRHDAWSRLLAIFRAVYGGVQHEDLQLRAYGGILFAPDRFPFLEGRAVKTSWKDTPADPLPIDNRTVLHLLEALQILQAKLPGGGPAEPRRISFRALGIEQIGHVYEGLLDHGAVRAAEPTLGLIGTRDKEPEIPLAELERLRQTGQAELLKFLKEETGRSESALKKAIESPDLTRAGALLQACGNDEALRDRVLPFATLVRDDTMGAPVVITAGSVYVTQSGDRRSTGTHYTPPSLTEPIVRYALEPIVYEGPADGKPAEEWRLKAPRDLLDLKVCDMAMGSGAFLVQACRYLADRLVDAWQYSESQLGAEEGKRVTILPNGDLSTGDFTEQILPDDPDERVYLARRLVADRCLYGVDINPMAVEMAKLSMWLLLLHRDRPFTFLDHAFKCGDSLLGVDKDQLDTWSMDRSGKKQLPLSSSPATVEAANARGLLRCMSERGVEDVREKVRLNRFAEQKMARLRLAGDLILAPCFLNGNAGAQQAQRTSFETNFIFDTPENNASLRAEADKLLKGHRTFHWPLEFPEVFLDGDRPGFDAIIGNPPFQGGQRITGTLGTDFRDYLVAYIANGKRGSADLCAYFYLRASRLLRQGGCFGLLATNTIAQGDTREVGLEQIAAGGATIYRAVPSRPWPGGANLEVAHVFVRRGPWNGDCVLDERKVAGITPYLVEIQDVTGTPYRLAANSGKSFQGSIVLGMGFVLEPEEAEALIRKDPRNMDVLFPYLNGEDVNSRPDQSPSRWVINFHDWPLERTAEGQWKSADTVQRKAWLRSGVVPKDYPEKVAADYPDCLGIVEEKVRPERQRLMGRNTIGTKRAQFWWRYGSEAKDLYAAIQGLERVLVGVLHTKYWNPAYQPNDLVFSHALVVMALPQGAHFLIIASTMHEPWAREYGGSLETRLRYSPSDSFETFPFPTGVADLNPIGETYYEHRQSVMSQRNEGLTTIYNRFHNPKEKSADIARLRELHVEMDRAVADAYGWTDLDLEHGFHETKQGVRFTISETARRDVLGRLLQLNHERYAEEVAQGLHDKGAKKSGAVGKGRKKTVVRESPSLYGEQNSEGV